MDRGRLWRRVTSDREELQKLAPDGFEAVVEVFLVGREEPVVPVYVESSSSTEYPWVRMQARAAAGEPGEPGERRGPEEYLVHVHESFVARVEIRFVRKGAKTLGFGAREVDEPDDAAD